MWDSEFTGMETSHGMIVRCLEVIFGKGIESTKATRD